MGIVIIEPLVLGSCGTGCGLKLVVQLMEIEFKKIRRQQKYIKRTQLAKMCTSFSIACCIHLHTHQLHVGSSL